MTPGRAGRGLRHQRWQSVLAVAAIGAAVALPVVLVGVGGGVAAHELASLEDTGYQLVVSAQGLHGIEHAHEDAARLLALPDVAYAAPILSVTIDVFNASGNVSPVLAEGVVPDQFLPTLGPTESGLFPDPLGLGDPNDSFHYDDGTYAGNATYDVLLSSTYATTFHVRKGSTVVLSPTTNESAGIAYNVSGFFGVPFTLAQPSGAFAALVLLSNLQSLTGYGGGPHPVVPDAADTLEVVTTPQAARDPTTLAQVAAEVHRALPAYAVTTLSSEAAQLQSADAVLTGFYLALSSVGLTVGLLFLTLVLVRRVERERRSIGIRRALGVPGRAIAGGIVLEAVAFAAVGAAAGVAAGVVVVDGLAAWGTATVREAARLAEFGPTFLAALSAAVIALAALASLVAVRSANRINLLEALR